MRSVKLKNLEAPIDQINRSTVLPFISPNYDEKNLFAKHFRMCQFPMIIALSIMQKNALGCSGTGRTDQQLNICHWFHVKNNRGLLIVIKNLQLHPRTLQQLDIYLSALSKLFVATTSQISLQLGRKAQKKEQSHNIFISHTHKNSWVFSKVCLLVNFTLSIEFFFDHWARSNKEKFGLQADMEVLITILLRGRKNVHIYIWKSDFWAARKLLSLPGGSGEIDEAVVSNYHSQWARVAGGVTHQKFTLR